MSSIEDRLHRQLSEEFIEANAADILLERQDEVDDGAGGTTLTDFYLVKNDPQRMRFIEPTQRGRSTGGAQSVEGMDIPSFILLAQWDADIRGGDQFTYDGTRFVVRRVMPLQRWRKRAEVDVHVTMD